MAADQGRWFKVWTSILDDPHFQELSLEEIGRWVLLGAMTKFVGTRGVLRGGTRRICEVLRCPPTELKRVVERFPNVSFSDAHEEGKTRHGEFTVTFKNWVKYQEDSTQAERAKTSRSKRRRDKKRRESPLPPTEPEGFSPPPIGSAGEAGEPRRAFTSEQVQTYLRAVEARRQNPDAG